MDAEDNTKDEELQNLRKGLQDRGYCTIKFRGKQNGIFVSGEVSARSH